MVLEDLTLSAIWSKSREEFRDLPCVGYAGGEIISYGQVDQNIQRLQYYLNSLGVKPRDKVAIVSESCPEWGQIYMAIVTMGGTVVPVMPDFSEEQLENILDHSESVFAFVSRKVLPRVINTKLAWNGRLGLIDRGVYQGKIGGEGEFKREGALFDSTSPGTDLIRATREDDLAAILYTSGTTGRSKGVMLSHRNISHNALSGTEVAKVTQDDRFLSVLPMAHSYECSLGLVSPLLAGASIHYIKGAPTGSILLPALEAVRPSLMLTVPVLMEKIYRLSILPKIRKSKLLSALYSHRPTQFLINRLILGKRLKKLFGGNMRFFGIGGAPLAPDVELFLRDAKFPYSVGYGLTETSPVLAGGLPSQSVFQGIGKAFPEVSLRIADVNPKTGHGEVQARGPNIMQGYYKDPEKTAEVFTEDGWFRTGDLGFLDKEGRLFLKGRLKSLILGPNGENIYPEEIEAVLNRNPFVLESLVIKIGNTLVARVQFNAERLDELVKTMKMSTQEEIQRYREELLETIKSTTNKSLSALSRLGKIIEQVEPFEKTPSLKIKRFLYTNLSMG